MKPMWNVSAGLLTLVILAGCGGTRSESPKQAQASTTDEKSSAPEDTPVGNSDTPEMAPTGPVHERNSAPDHPEYLAQLKMHVEQSKGDPETLLTIARGSEARRFNLDSGFGWESAALFDQYLQQAKSPSLEARLDAAVSYLLVGRFDSALAVLEAGNQASDSPLLATFQGHAQRVQQALTKARDDLWRQGVKVHFPHEAIFIEALSKVDGTSRYLILNLVDAHVAAHPTSPLAIRELAEANLSVYESLFSEAGRRASSNDVPRERAESCRWRGESALYRHRKLEPRNPFPTIRMIQFNRAVDGLPRVPSLFIVPDDDAGKDLSDLHKAYMNYGRALYYLTMNEGWGMSVADPCIQWLKQATEWAPEVKEFRELLEYVQNNKQKINQEMETLARRQRERSRARAADAFGQTQGHLRRQQVDRAMYDAINLLFQVSMDEVRKKSPATADFFHRCVVCYGSGKAFWKDSTSVCPACLGSGLPPSH